MSRGSLQAFLRYLGSLQFQLVDGQRLPLQAAGTDREELFQCLDVVLDFGNSL